jgi:Matrixin/Putative peptidoglycan binding domain
MKRIIRTGLKVGTKHEDVTALQSALIELGFLRTPREVELDLDEPETRCADGEFDRVTETALLAYQRERGLSQTGMVDAATETALTSFTCGFRMYDQFVAASIPSFEPKAVYTYSFENEPVLRPSDRISITEIRRSVQQGFAVWAAETKLSFERVDANGDISIRFDDVQCFTCACSVLGSVPLLNTLPRTGKSVIAFYFTPECSDDNRWVYEPNDDFPFNTADFVSVAVHEIGHALGLGHYSSGVMKENLDHGELNRSLSLTDIAKIQAIWGVDPVAQALGVHGTVAVIQTTAEGVTIVKTPQGTTMVGSQPRTQRVLLPLVGVSRIEQVSFGVNAVSLSFKTYHGENVGGAIAGNLSVEEVAIWDGSKRLVLHRLDLQTMDRPRGVQSWVVKLGVPNKPVVSGLCLEVAVRFTGHGRIDFSTVRGDYVRRPFLPPTSLQHG